MTGRELTERGGRQLAARGGRRLARQRVIATEAARQAVRRLRAARRRAMIRLAAVAGLVAAAVLAVAGCLTPLRSQQPLAPAPTSATPATPSPSR